jgi:hypothetical protein
MDISGPIRGLFPQLLRGQTAPDPDPPDPLLLFAHLVADPHFVPPDFAQLRLTRVDGVSRHTRAVYPYLAQAAALRMLPRLPRGLRARTVSMLAEAGKSTWESAKRLLALRRLPVDVLWHYWLLVLVRRQLHVEIPDFLLNALWQRAWSGLKADGPLHALTPEVSLDVATYYDLCALHAAFNAIIVSQNFDLFPPVQRLVDWHVANTQPDHITTEPWALAAFASLDATGTFAPQQLHDTTTHAASHGATLVVLALLADALASQDETAGL